MADNFKAAHRLEMPRLAEGLDPEPYASDSSDEPLLGFESDGWADKVMSDFDRLPTSADSKIEGWCRDLGVGVVTVSKPTESYAFAMWSAGTPVSCGYRVAVSLRGPNPAGATITVNDRPVYDIYIARRLALRAEGALRELHPAFVLVDDEYPIPEMAGESPAIKEVLAHCTGLVELVDVLTDLSPS